MCHVPCHPDNDACGSILHLHYSTNGREFVDGPKDDDDQDQDATIRKEEPAQTVRVKQFHVRPGCEEGENLLSDLLAIDVTLSREGTPPDDELHLMAMTQCVIMMIMIPSQHMPSIVYRCSLSSDPKLEGRC